MTLIHSLRSLCQTMAVTPALGSQPCLWDEGSGDVHLDELTDSGLALREALPVRSAEYWMEMGCPELALEELDTLNAHAPQHPWPRRIHQQATLAAAN